MDAGAQLLDCKPKYAMIADLFREQIMRGAFKRGDKLLPDKELALKYRVNAQTMAAGLNLLVKEGLLERAPRRGTVVSRADEERIVNNAVGMVMVGEGDVYGDIVRLVAKEFTRHCLYPMLIDRRLLSDPGQVTQFLSSFVSERARPYGFLIEGDMRFPFAFLKERLDLFRNTVFIHAYHHPERIAAAKYALVDFPEAGRAAARHFIAGGHKRMACLAVPELGYQGLWASIQTQIQAGFVQECRENGVAFSDEVFWRLLHGAPFEATVNALLQGEGRPTAIFSYADYFVRSGVIPLLQANGLTPMQDVELIGFYNTPHAVECGFSSISVQEEKIAAAAVRLLTGETNEQEILIKPELVVRHGVNG